MSKVLGKSRQAEHLLRDGKGFFALHCDNRKKQGRHGYRALEAQGAQFTSGRIRLDTDLLRDEEGRLINGFESMQAMLDTLSEWGDVAVVWEDEGQKGSGQ